MLPRPGADDAVSNAMPSCWKMRANQRIVSTSLPGGFVVLMRRYSRVWRTASSCSLTMSIDCCAAARWPASETRQRTGARRDRALIMP